LKHYEITRPIGLKTPCAEIERVCKAAHVYRKCGLRPGHFVVPLDAGNGRTTLLEYMADMYKEAGVLDFISGPDDYIEITLDGSRQQLRQAFVEIDAAAVYTNEYCNIIGMDISGMAGHAGETQFAEFLRYARRTCEHACVVFYVGSVPTRNEERMLEKLCETVENIKRLDANPYTQEEICSLILKFLEDHGIEIRDEARFRSMLPAVVASLELSDVKEAAAAVEEMIFSADFSGFKPAVDVSCLMSLMESRKEEKARREAV